MIPCAELPQIKTKNASRGADVNPFGKSIGTNTFDIEGFAFFVQPSSGNPAQEFVPVVDVEHQQSVSTILQVIANAGFGYIQQFVFAGCQAASEARNEPKQDKDSGEDQKAIHELLYIIL